MSFFKNSKSMAFSDATSNVLPLVHRSSWYLPRSLEASSIHILILLPSIVSGYTFILLYPRLMYACWIVYIDDNMAKMAVRLFKSPFWIENKFWWPKRSRFWKIAPAIQRKIQDLSSFICWAWLCSVLIPQSEGITQYLWSWLCLWFSCLLPFWPYTNTYTWNHRIEALPYSICFVWDLIWEIVLSIKMCVNAPTYNKITTAGSVTQDAVRSEYYEYYYHYCYNFWLLYTIGTYKNIWIEWKKGIIVIIGIYVHTILFLRTNAPRSDLVWSDLEL